MTATVCLLRLTPSRMADYTILECELCHFRWRESKEQLILILETRLPTNRAKIKISTLFYFSDFFWVTPPSGDRGRKGGVTKNFTFFKLHNNRGLWSKYELLTPSERWERAWNIFARFLQKRSKNLIYIGTLILNATIGIFMRFNPPVDVFKNLAQCF